MTDQPIKIKKVQPYPIPAVLTGRAAPLPCKILKLTLTGALIDTGGAQLQTHEKVGIEFALPVIKSQIKTESVVIKFYDRLIARPGEQKVIERWDELQFTNLTSAMKTEIHKFLLAIRQT